MKKINYNNLNQELYYFILKNGLKVYLVPYQEKKNFYVILGTKYGSNDVQFYDQKGNLITTPYGTAHFLEHKLFDQENGEDPFLVFSKSGISTNASTTFDNTRYYIWGVNDLKGNLNYFLNLVFSPYFVPESIEKEKGIIKEEILMYEDNPEWALDDTMRKNLFYELPIKEKIAGTVTSIEDITKADLDKAYETFYNPSNMYLVIGGNFQPKEIENLIKNHQLLNSIKGNKNLKRKEYQEPKDVKEEYEQLTMNIKVPKIRYSFKINKDQFTDFSDIELNMYLGVIMSELFGSTSDFKEYVTMENLSSGFYIEKNNYSNYLTLDVTAESDKADLFIDYFNQTINNIKITKSSLERIKKVWIASEIRMIDNLELTVDNIYSDLIMYDKVYANRIDLIRELNIKKLNKLLKMLDLSNKSLVMILPSEKGVK